MIMTFSFYKPTVFENNEAGNELEEEKEEENIGYKMSGYYYLGFFDEKEKLDSEFENDYFYIMDNHFQDYYDYIIMFSEGSDLEEEHIQFIELAGRQNRHILLFCRH